MRGRAAATLAVAIVLAGSTAQAETIARTVERAGGDGLAPGVSTGAGLWSSWLDEGQVWSREAVLNPGIGMQLPFGAYFDGALVVAAEPRDDVPADPAVGVPAIEVGDTRLIDVRVGWRGTFGALGIDAGLHDRYVLGAISIRSLHARAEWEVDEWLVPGLGVMADVSPDPGGRASLWVNFGQDFGAGFRGDLRPSFSLETAERPGRPGSRLDDGMADLLVDADVTWEVIDALSVHARVRSIAWRAESIRPDDAWRSWLSFGVGATSTF